MAKRPDNDTIIELFKVKMGNKTDVAEALNVSRVALYNWINADDKLRDEIKAQEEANIDFVESKLFEKITGISVIKTTANGEEILYSLPPSDTAIIFFLKTRAKSRGYVERQELTGKDGNPIQLEGTWIPPSSPQKNKS